MQSQTCASIDSNTPFCVNDQCTKTPDMRNSNCIPHFECMSEGIFPDPYDCTSYHYCVGTQAIDQRFNCPDGYVFNLQKQLCSRKDIYSVCETVDCSRTVNGYILFKSSPAYYAMCFAINAIYVFKCSDEDNMVFDANLGECVYNCPGVGNFVNTRNCNSYIMCTKKNGKLEGSEVNCQKNYWFNNGKCEKEVKPCSSASSNSVETTTKTTPTTTKATTPKTTPTTTTTRTTPTTTKLTTTTPASTTLTTTTSTTTTPISTTPTATTPTTTSTTVTTPTPTTTSTICTTYPRPGAGAGNVGGVGNVYAVRPGTGAGAGAGVGAGAGAGNVNCVV